MKFLIPLRKITVYASSLVLLMFISSLTAQTTDLAEEFLEGLPPSIRAQIEVQNEVGNERELAELFSSDTSLEKNKVILQRLEDQLDVLKERFAALEGDARSQKLERYGNLFFQSIQSSFMPVNIPNAASSYILDVGDTLSILMTGSRSDQFSTVIERDGSIIIPQLGKIYVAGKSINDAEKSLKAFIANKTVGVEGFLSLSEMRDIQILILGGVETAGIFTLSGGSNILSALNAVGGISANGSFRQIEHKRNGEIIKVYDLYDVFVSGNYIFETSLRTGDVIFVRPKSFEVPITGGVAYQAIYEILDGETVYDAIKFAGGFSQGFDGFDSIRLNRTSLEDSNQGNVLLSDIDKEVLKVRDAILVPSFEREISEINRIEISGFVNRPGTYFLNEGQTLRDLIDKAGGYKSGAYVFGGALFREDALAKQKEYAQLNYAETVNYLVTNGGGGSGSMLDLLAEEIRSSTYFGRVITDFSIGSLSNPEQNIVLMNNDKIVIPPLQKLVYVFGEFKLPATVKFENMKTIEDYINAAGGLKDSSLDDLIVVDPDGNAHIYKTGFLRKFANNVPIYPGSIIYAPKEIGKLDGLQYVATVSPVLSSLALTIASLQSISD